MTHQARPKAGVGRTVPEVLADQKQQTARDAAARPAAPPVAKPTAVVPAAKPSLPAVSATRTPVQQYLDKYAPAMLVGRIIRANKEHVFVTADDGTPVPDNVDFIALCDQTMVGYTHFNGEGQAPDQIMGLLYDGFCMPDRAELSDLDETKWETGLDGRPQDPWRHFNYVVLQRGDTGEMFTYTTASVTGRRAVGNLLRHYDRLQRTRPDTYPVVRLTEGGFNHRDDRVGWVSTPVFRIVGSHAKDDASKPDSSLRADFQDEVPF